MSNSTTIEWTRGEDGTPGATWNPVTGCTEVSEGCGKPRWQGDQPGGCYAKTFAERWRGIPGHPFEQGFDVRLWPDRLEMPLRWRKPRRVFVNSMSDLSGGVKNFQGRIVGLFPQVETPVRRSASCATGVVHGRANDAMSLRRRGDAR